MNIFRVFDSDLKPADVLCRGRKVPSQPDDVEAGKVYLGSDVGTVPYQGDRPKPGEMVMIVGAEARKVALGSQPRALRAPTFGSDCSCNCKNDQGTIIYANQIQRAPLLVVLYSDQTIRQIIEPTQIYKIAGVAVDIDSPNNLYVLDDRSQLTNKITDTAPDLQVAGVSTYCLHTFILSGGQYVWSSVVEMPDPGLPLVSPTFFNDELNWVTRDPADFEAAVGDPPSSYPGNCMAVIDGLLTITMSKRPARYLTWNGASFTTHSLTYQGSGLNKGLRGRIVTGLDSPGKRSLRYVLAWWGYGGFSGDGNGGYELLQFTIDDQVTRRLASDNLYQSPIQLIAVCNRLVVLNSNYYGRAETGGSGDLDGSVILSGVGP